ncbi:hypothetical protein EJV47_01615 [Hymenobacter gummosus]|uniref:Uncharacterized protein n=1 Tax=Hymenobacter gummosus TaxID=1776032 RepID=A0A431U895_9BACT|nr:hypothetical protein [Hymenobacter gummosus]RTQ53463.1 hypothetical protein EJV47_01615 [Hymenobacter gummosus]
MLPITLLFVTLFRPPRPQAGELSVRAELVGRNKDYEGQKGEKALFVRLEVRNQAHRPLTFYQMSCSWTDSWAVEGAYHLSVLLCDKDAPTPVTLAPRQAIVYYGRLRPLGSARATTRPARLRLAFVPGFITGDLLAGQPSARPLAYAAARKLPVFGSNSFTTDFYNDSYRLSPPGR